MTWSELTGGTGVGTHVAEPRPVARAQPLLELEGVSRVYGEEVEVYALREVSLQIMPGDFMSIVGPSGSGKSTMLGLLGVLDLPTAGTIRIAGQDVSKLDDATRSRLRGDSIGFVFQQFHLIPHLTALGNVETALLYRDLSARQRHERAYAALERLGLGNRADHRPVQMSGGEQQRVALARAIVTDPLMILADEPTGALDTANAKHVLEIFQGLQSPERAVVMVTHDPTVANTAKRKVSMRDGQIVTDEHLNVPPPQSQWAPPPPAPPAAPPPPAAAAPAPQAPQSPWEPPHPLAPEVPRVPPPPYRPPFEQ